MLDIAQFYFSKTVPANAVAIAQISAKAATAADLVDINNLTLTAPALAPGAYTITAYPVPHVWNAVVLNNPVSFQGSHQYLVQNQFFELTNIVDANGNPLFYRHLLPGGVTDVTVLHLDGTPASDFLVANNAVYHSFSGAPLWVKYYSHKLLYTEMLRCSPALTPCTSATDPSYQANTGYIYNHSVIQLNSLGAFWIRWVQDSGYRVLPPYNVMPNDPWFARVRFNPLPGAPEWARQMFVPFRPYQLAAWVPGTVLDKQIVEFERKPILFDGQTYPDILVYDKDYNLKYAIDGSPVNTPLRKGYLFPWKRALYRPNGIDALRARVNLQVEVDATDQIFGFYFYAEPDIVYTGLDLNPFTNRAVANRTVQFLYKPNTVNPYQNVYHRMLNDDGTVDSTPGTSNDPNPAHATEVVLAEVSAGDTVVTRDFTITDVRTPGGGLAPEYQSIDQAANFWDLGHLDGKPYPLGGAAAVYLPTSLLKPNGPFSSSDLKAKVAAVLPMGALATVRYYDAQANESI